MVRLILSILNSVCVSFCWVFLSKKFVKISVSSGNLWQEIDKIVKMAIKGNGQRKSFRFNVFLAAIAQYTRRMEIKHGSSRKALDSKSAC